MFLAISTQLLSWVSVPEIGVKKLEMTEELIYNESPSRRLEHQ